MPGLKEREERVDSASRIVGAAPKAVYAAFVQPDAVAAWLPPQGMAGRVDSFDPRPGGDFCITLTYRDAHEATPGKTSEHSDSVKGRFVELFPHDRIVQAVSFVSDDPAFTGEMTMTWTFAAVAGGTKVEIRCTSVPSGIAKQEHDEGLRSTLENLAAFVE